MQSGDSFYGWNKSGLFIEEKFGYIRKIAMLLILEDISFGIV